jgi:hypothetical protein
MVASLVYGDPGRDKKQDKKGPGSITFNSTSRGRVGPVQPVDLPDECFQQHVLFVFRAVLKMMVKRALLLREDFQ